MKEDFKENPFENRPVELDEEPSFKENPFENVPREADYEEIPILTEEFDRSKLALISGVGFVGLAIFLYFFILTSGEPLFIALSVFSIVTSTLIALFYLLDDLTIRPTKMTERAAHLFSGIFLGILIFLIIETVLLYPGDLIKVGSIFIVMVLTNVSVALFLYSLLWEE